MKITKLWTSKLANPFVYGLKPIIDPFSNSFFYISDGYGSSFASMKLRKLCLHTGVELAAIKTNNSIRCIYFNQESTDIFAVSDNKIFRIDNKHFNIKEKLTVKIPQYSDFISSDNDNTLLLMNSRGKNLSIYHMLEGKSVTQKLQWCSAVKRDSKDCFLIFSPLSEGVFRYDLSKKTLNKIVTTGVFSTVSFSDMGVIFLQHGEYISEKKGEGYAISDYIKKLPEISVYRSIEDVNPLTLKLGFDFDDMIPTSESTIIYLTYDNILYEYSTKERRVLRKYEFEDNMRISTIWSKEKKIFTYDPCEGSTLHCWSID